MNLVLTPSRLCNKKLDLDRPVIVTLPYLLRLISIMHVPVMSPTKSQLARVSGSERLDSMALDIATSKVMCLARAKGIRRLAVDGVVALEELFLAHAQRDAQHVLDEEQDQARPQQIPADDEHGACHLVALCPLEKKKKKVSKL